MKQRIEEALFQHLLANSAIPLIGSGVGGLLVALAQVGSSDSRFAIAWLVLLYATTALRYWLTRRCRVRVVAQGYTRSESMRYSLSTGLSGLVWGVAGLMVPGAAPLAMIIVITAIQAMVMGAVLTLGAFMPSFLSFSLPAILPMIVVLALGGDVQTLVLAIYSAIFFVLMVGVAKRFNNSLRLTLQLRFEKEDLVRALTAAHDHLAVLAETDGLTGVANRRRFDEVLEAEFTRLRRSRAPLSLIFLDVDHFKAFNDTYGHVAGDQCLKSVAEVFQQYLNRSPDFAARYGGEEFAGILPETGHQGAIALAEKIRTAVAGLNMPHRASETAPCVTVSLGVVTLDCSRIQSPADVLVIADRELYRAKSAGRNRVAAWCDSQEALN